MVAGKRGVGFLPSVFGVLFFEIGSRVAQTGLKLTVYPKLALKVSTSYLYLPSPGLTNMVYHAQLALCEARVIGEGASVEKITLED